MVSTRGHNTNWCFVPKVREKHENRHRRCSKKDGRKPHIKRQFEADDGEKEKMVRALLLMHITFLIFSDSATIATFRRGGSILIKRSFEIVLESGLTLDSSSGQGRSWEETANRRFRRGVSNSRFCRGVSKSNSRFWTRISNSRFCTWISNSRFWTRECCEPISGLGVLDRRRRRLDRAGGDRRQDRLWPRQHRPQVPHCRRVHVRSTFRKSVYLDSGPSLDIIVKNSIFRRETVTDTVTAYVPHSDVQQGGRNEFNFFQELF